MKVIDLRSDTVTKPTEEMREAMMRAEVGDDVYREDPTVIELEEYAAELFGKEAGLLVVSGTMGNQVSIMAQTQRGDEVILESESHVYHYEVGAMAVLSGVMPHPVKGNRGVMDPEDVRRAIRPENIHFPKTSLIIVENTHNRGGGKIIPLDNMRSLYEIAKEYGLRVHLDGARIFNASVATGISVKKYAEYADSIMFCLSKGLGAPIGSVVVGDKDFIERARKARKMLGGGMRQAGVIAAAGLVALRTMVDRLREDHENAKRLALALRDMGYDVDPDQVETNMVMVNVRRAYEFVENLKNKGVLANAISPERVRLVTHKDVSRDDIDRAVEVFGSLVSSVEN